jgi:hypothetical protein
MRQNSLAQQRAGDAQAEQRYRRERTDREMQRNFYPGSYQYQYTEPRPSVKPKCQLVTVNGVVTMVC